MTDELRGRTFATLYAVVRLCLLLSLTVSPLFADLYDWLFSLAAGRAAHHARRVQLRLPRRAPRALGRRGPHDRLGPLRPPRAAGDARPRGRAAPSVERPPVAAPEAAAGGRRAADASRPAARGGGERMTGRFIVLEGGDGSGKSTQVPRLAARLRDARSSTWSRRVEPGGTPLGQQLRAAGARRRRRGRSRAPRRC